MHWIGRRLVSVGLGAVVFAGAATGIAFALQANQPPTAVVAADRTTADVGTFILFDGTGSSDPDGTIVTFSWDFGDGSPVVSGDAVEASQVFHSYGADGTYTVTLTVTDDQGATSDPTAPQATVTIVVGTGTPTTTTTTATTTTSTTTTTTAPGGTVSGGAVYAAYCAACHGASGEGGIGPSLQASTVSLSQMVSIVKNGVGSMPGFGGSLSQAEIDAVSSYSVRLQRPSGETTTTSSTTSTTLAPGAAVDAVAVYSANCAICHGASGEGDSGPSLQTSTVSFSEMVSIVTDGVGEMPGFAGALSEDEIQAVSQFSLAFQAAGGVVEEQEPGPESEPSDEEGVLAEGGPGDGGEAEEPASEPAAEPVQAVEPSRFVEFDQPPSRIPLDRDTMLALALGSIAFVGILALWEVWRGRGAGGRGTG